MKRYFLFSISILFCISSYSQDSLNMTRLSVTGGLGDEYNDVWGYRHGAEEFAVIGSNSAINILNVTDCANPVLVDQWVDGTSTIWRDMKDYNDYIYALCDGGGCTEGLQIINKNTYSHIQSTSEFERAHNIFIDAPSGRLYVMGANTLSHGMYIYDIKTDPSTPTLLKALNFRTVENDPTGNYYVHDAYIKNDTAYCNHGYPGMRIWDLRDLDNVYKIGEVEANGGYNHSSWMHPNGDYLYVAEEVPIGRPIALYDISNAEDPFTELTFKDPLLAPTHTNNRPHNPLVHLNWLYISYYHDGIQVYDIEDPLNPEVIAYYDTYSNTSYSGYQGAWGVYPFLPSGCILASDITSGLSTLKHTEPPQASSGISGSDFIIEDHTKGIVFSTPDGDLYRITVNVAGSLVKTSITAPSSSALDVVNSNMKFDAQNIGFVLKNSIGKYFRIGVDNAGNLILSSITAAPSSSLVIENEDVFISQYRGGIIMKNALGSCYHFTLGNGGINEIELTDCD